MQNCSFKLFHIPDLILYSLKTLKRVWSSDDHRGYRKTLEEDQLMEADVQNTLWKDAGHRSSLSGRCYEQVLDILIIFTANINLLKINERNVRKRCDIYLKLTIKAPVSLLLTLIMICHTFLYFSNVYCWLWTGKCSLGIPFQPIKATVTII